MHEISEKSSCSVSGCCKPVHGKGCCKVHYHRLCRYGDPLGGSTMEGEPMRFILEVALHHTGDECLIWPFAKNSWGYGAVRVGGKDVGTHRYVCELAHGAPPSPEHHAAHSCGKGHDACIAPGHLSWKTPVENASDRLVHGTHARGERSARAKLTEANVSEILAMNGVEPKNRLAKRFGVSPMTVYRIHTGRAWTWLTEEDAR